MPVLSTTARAAEEGARKRKQDVLQETGKPSFEDDQMRAIESRPHLPVSMQTKLLRPRVEATGWFYAERDLSSAVLMMMSAHFDRFIGDMVEFFFEIEPARRKDLKRELSFTDFADLPDIEAVYHLVIEKEVEQILRDSRSAQIKWFESRCGMRPIDPLLEEELSDIAELRNLIAHHGGQITNRVAFGRRSRKTRLLRNYQAGEQITITPDDIAAIHDILFVAAMSVAQGVWRLRVDQRESADAALHELTYSRLALEEFALAQRALLVTSESYDTMMEPARLVNTINLAQTYKWLEDPDGCREVLGRENWDQHEIAFQFAVTVLRDDWDKAALLMDRCAQERQVSQAEFENWPALREFRNTDQYQKVFRRAYGT